MNAAVPDTPIAPIRNDAEHEAALRQIEALWNAEPGTADHDRLEVLGTLADAYEATRWPIDAPDPVEAIRAHMDTAGYQRADLVKLLGSRSRATEILGKRRALTLPMIWRLTREWRIPAEILIAPYALKKSGAGLRKGRTASAAGAREPAAGYRAKKRTRR
jgi:HTH-type transcriptional regulator / antitoxin HigA